jgi:DNA-binding transcriptional regulator YdaS (Cro superfamily)
MTLSEYIRAARGNAVALAGALGVHKSQISNWARPFDPDGKNMIPPARCVEIERATQGAVTRKELRPDWETIWPELAAPCSSKKPWNGQERRGVAR